MGQAGDSARGGDRSRYLRADPRRGAAAVRENPADRVGELRLARGARGHRLGAHEQVLRRLSGQALLRGPAVHRSDRAAAPSSRQGAVRRRPRQRAAVLRLAREPRRLPRVLPSRATPSWAWRCPPAATSRTAGTSASPASSSRASATACARTPAASISTRSATLAARSSPKLSVLRRHRDPAHDRLRRRSRRSRTRSGAILVADIAHIAGLVAGGAHPSPVAHADVVSTTTHKTLRGPRGGMLMCKRRARRRHRQGRVPRAAGRPAQPHDRRHRGRAERSVAADAFKKYAHQIVANAQARSRRRSTGAASRWSPAAPTTT